MKKLLFLALAAQGSTMVGMQLARQNDVRAAEEQEAVNYSNLVVKQIFGLLDALEEQYRENGDKFSSAITDMCWKALMEKADWGLLAQLVKKESRPHVYARVADAIKNTSVENFQHMYLGDMIILNPGLLKLRDLFQTLETVWAKEGILHCDDATDNCLWDALALSAGDYMELITVATEFNFPHVVLVLKKLKSNERYTDDGKRLNHLKRNR